MRLSLPRPSTIIKAMSNPLLDPTHIPTINTRIPLHAANGEQVLVNAMATGT